MSSTSKPLDWKYLSADSHEIDGDGKSTHDAFDSYPSLLPKRTG